MRRNINRIIISLAILLLMFYIFISMGFRFTEKSAIKAIFPGDLVIKSELNNNKEIYLLCDNIKTELFYDIILERKLFGLLYKYKSSNSYNKSYDEPFVMTGSIDYKHKRGYFGFKINNVNIKYISIGVDDLQRNMISKENLTLNYIKSKPERFKYSHINSNKYVTFVYDNYVQKNFVIRAFNSTGKLYIEKYLDSKIMYF